MTILIYMIATHFLVDYPLQGEWLSAIKNPSISRVPGETIWPLALFGHAIMHAVVVQIITGSWSLFVIELAAHMAIDYSKCKGRFGYNTDQYLHLICKAAYAAAIFFNFA